MLSADTVQQNYTPTQLMLRTLRPAILFPTAENNKQTCIAHLTSNLDCVMNELHTSTTIH